MEGKKSTARELPSDIFQQILSSHDNFEQTHFNEWAYHSKQATRFTPEKRDYRSPFTRDSDRIIHSLSYARFFDKTQVFFWVASDMHSHRMLHVQLVSKISREIAQVLGLNAELVEAIALGHDIGHCPWGHDGEAILSNITQKHGIDTYHHNQGSVWILQEVEMQNLTLPVVDGILCHNGESHQHKIHPQDQHLSWDFHQTEMKKVLQDSHYDPQPKTMEGALVRMVDVISYISRDVMDAEHLGILRFEDIPPAVQEELGTSNRSIINTLITDLIKNSYEKPFVAFSEGVFNRLQELYRFNYTKIYTHPDKQAPLTMMREAMKNIWDHYYTDLCNKTLSSRIYTDHLLLNINQIRTRYPEIHSLETYPYYQQPPEIIVRDFIAGMTDQFFWQIAKELDENHTQR